MARGRHYAKLSLSNAARLSFSDPCILLFLFLSLCRLCVCVFLCSHWSLVDVPLIFFCPADHVPDWQPRVLLGMVEARSVNVKKTTTTTTTTVCLPTALCYMLVCHCMFRAGRVDVDVRLEQVRRGCMVSAGRSVFALCMLVRAESDSCGRNGRWKGLIFRHNRVHVQNQGVGLRKNSPHGVYPAHFPARQGENVRRPISSLSSFHAGCK